MTTKSARRARAFSKFRNIPGGTAAGEGSTYRASNSLRTGKLTGNFSGFGPFGRFLCPIDQINQRLAPQFPEPGGTGNFYARNREFTRLNRESPYAGRSQGNDLRADT